MQPELERGSVGHVQGMDAAQPVCLLVRTVTHLTLPLPNEPRKRQDISQHPKLRCSRQAGYSRQDTTATFLYRVGNSCRRHLLSLSTSVTKPTVRDLLRSLPFHQNLNQYMTQTDSNTCRPTSLLRRMQLSKRATRPNAIPIRAQRS